jgi:hypothetical protein
VTIAVPNGDLSRKITVDVRGEILQLKRHHHHGGPRRSFAGSDARGPQVGTRASSAYSDRAGRRRPEGTSPTGEHTMHAAT